MKKLVLIVGLLLALCGLAGCGGETAGDSGAGTGSQLFVYCGNEGYGLAKADGTMVVEPGDYTFELINDMTTSPQKQTFAVQTVSVWDEESLNEYGQPLLLERTFNFYSTQGKLLKSVTVELAEGSDDSDVVLYQTADGDLAKARILVNELITKGRYKVLDTDGNEIVDVRVMPPYQWQYGYAYMVMSDYFMAVDCSFYGMDWLDGESSLHFWDMNGETMAMAQEYTGISWLYDDLAQRYSGYYVAEYALDDETLLTDVLDEQGQVVLSGLSEVISVNGDLFVVTKDGVHGIMNKAGEWVYQEQPVG